jgi:hypothetical protein
VANARHLKKVSGQKIAEIPNLKTEARHLLNSGIDGRRDEFLKKSRTPKINGAAGFTKTLKILWGVGSRRQIPAAEYPRSAV